jgi:hypothetical protein
LAATARHVPTDELAGRQAEQQPPCGTARRVPAQSPAIVSHESHGAVSGSSMTAAPENAVAKRSETKARLPAMTQFLEYAGRWSSQKGRDNGHLAE